MIKPGFLLLLFMLGLPVVLEAQCCSAGNPLSPEAGKLRLKPGELVVSASFRHSVADQYYSGATWANITGPGIIEKSWHNFSKLNITYGVLPWLAIQVEQGYFFIRAEKYGDQTIGTIMGRGIADLQASIRTQHRLGKATFFIPSFGITFPVGQFDLEEDRVRLPISLQPGSGDYKYHLNARLLKSFPRLKTDAHLTLGFEYPVLIHTRNFYYKYGLRYHATAYVAGWISKNVLLGGLLNCDIRGKATREQNQIVNSSGYRVFSIAPQGGINLTEDLHVSTMLEIPVLRYFNGIQLGNKYAVSVNFSYTFRKRSFRIGKIVAPIIRPELIE
ncbi:MAG: hypothetical protein KA053_05465 [Lentimicrobiaceae bacterium]|nr:hypothetical protein [Lentimicrobiaceae bacterium]